MKVRIRFTKKDKMRFVGHLDMMRFFQKAIRRAGLDIAYSEGYNPHQILSFASPLGLGMSSDGEYFDAEFNSVYSEDVMLSKLNKEMVSGVEVLSFTKLKDDKKNNAMASLFAASYTFCFNDEYINKYICGSINELFESFYNNDKILVHKVTKTNEMDIDIKPLIIEHSIEDNKIKLLLLAGSVNTVKPVLVMDAFLKSFNNKLSAKDAFVNGEMTINRNNQYTLINDKLISLSDVGEDL